MAVGRTIKPVNTEFIQCFLFVLETDLVVVKTKKAV